MPPSMACWELALPRRRPKFLARTALPSNDRIDPVTRRSRHQDPLQGARSAAIGDGLAHLPIWATSRDGPVYDGRAVGICAARRAGGTSGLVCCWGWLSLQLQPDLSFRPPGKTPEALPLPAAGRAFQASHPCPSTGRSSGACPGYVKDHIVPLKRGGADKPENMQWQTTEAAKAKDKIE